MKIPATARTARGDDFLATLYAADEFLATAYAAGKAYALNPVGKYAAGYAGASLGEGDYPVGALARGYTAYSDGYCAGLRAAGRTR